MQRRVPVIVVSLITLVATAAFGFTLVRAAFYSPEEEIPSGPVIAATSTLPVRLIIPSLDVNAKIQQVGIAKSGNMAVPSNFTDVGWFKVGTVPGRLGSAVMDGHVDNALGMPGVFSRLSELEDGDEVFVEQQDGTRLRFLVTDKRSYPYDEAPRTDIFTRADTARLNLITCEGAWIQSEKSYDHRLVVYTELAPS